MCAQAFTCFKAVASVSETDVSETKTFDADAKAASLCTKSHYVISLCS